MARQSFRLRFQFWLDMYKPSERVIAEKIDELKEDRLFAQTIRDGIRLIIDLREGRSVVLHELFPDIAKETGIPEPQSDSGGDDDMRAQLERMERLLLSQNNGALMAPVVSNGDPKPLAVQPVAGPVFNDDEDDAPLIVRTATPSGNSAQAFLDQCFDFVGQ